ncbi:hypothetical protein MMC30_000596 [Trapelia coarctata]|nr:hypothetical protein [Trapelia coarctata]
MDSTFEAGSALETMILATAVDKTLAPTAHQLKDLLDVLEPRLNRAGFLGELLGWKDWWEKNGVTMGSGDFDELYTSPKEVHHIVSAFREVARLGDAAKIVFTAGKCAPWLTHSPNGVSGCRRTHMTRKARLYSSSQSVLSLFFIHGVIRRRFR